MVAQVAIANKPTTRKHVEQNLGDITPAMLNLAHKVYDLQAKQNIYFVETTSGTTDKDGNLEEYKVSYIPGKGFGCTCKSGQYAFANVRHESGVCIHCRIATAHAKEEKIASTLLSLKQSEAALRGWGLKQIDVEILQHHIKEARSALAILGYKLPTIEEKMGIKAWMLR